MMRRFAFIRYFALTTCFSLGLLTGNLCPKSTFAQDGSGVDYRRTQADELDAAITQGDLEKVKSLLATNSHLFGVKSPLTGEPWLTRAVKAGQVETVVYLLDRGANPNEQAATSGMVPLNIAILRADGGWKAISEALVTKGADVNRADIRKGLPLAAVLRESPDNSYARIEWLIAKGAKVNLLLGRKPTPLQTALAIPTTSTDILRLMFAQIDIKAPDAAGNTLLHEACRNDNEQAVRLLLKIEADINAKNMVGDTPLHDAAQKPSPVLKALLDAGADANIKNNAGDMPLHLALRRFPNVGPVRAESSDPNSATSRAAFLRPLIEKTRLESKNNAGFTPLLVAITSREQDAYNSIRELSPPDDETTRFLDAVARGNSITARRLAGQNPALVSTPLADGTTALHISALWGTLQTAQVLVEKGADVKAQNASGATPLHEALWQPTGLYLKRAVNMMTFLLAQGADVNATDNQGRSPLYQAVPTGEEVLVSTLIAQGAQVDAADKEGRTPLLLAITPNSSFAIAQQLIAHGANANVRTQSGQHILLRAVDAWRLDFVRLLLENGADITSKESVTPDIFIRLIHYLHNQGTTASEIFALLLDKGADPNTKVYNMPLVVDLMSFAHSTSKEWEQFPGRMEMFKTLLATKKVELGANSRYPSLLVQAVTKGWNDVSEALLDAGANPNEKDANGKTVLGIAKTRNDEAIVAMLTAKGAKE